MSWNTFFGVASIFCFLFPAGVITICKLYNHKSLAALLVYYILTAIYVLLTQQAVPSAPLLLNYFGVAINYLDAPLMLTVLLFFCSGKTRQKNVNWITFAFLGYELIVTLINGFNVTSLVYILGPGLIIVLFYTFFLFGRQVKLTIIHGKNLGRTLMLAAILFAYTCYVLIYYFYYVQKTPYKQDTLLIYYLSSIIASLLMGTGLMMMRKRIRELQALQLTRKELALFFGT
jgi:hypothetical protein